MNVDATIVTPLRPPVSVRANATSPADDAATLSLTARMMKLEEEAFSEFHAAYFDRLLRYLFVVTADEQLARDALQETFVRVARHARGFKSEEVFWSWLTVLARSAATDVVRKRNRYWRLLSSYATNLLSLISSPRRENDDRLLQLIGPAMAVLADRDKVLVSGKYLRGLSVRDLAEEHGLTEKSVESRLRRARIQLKAELIRRMNDEG